MKKKILHIISQYPERTGSGTYLRSLIKEFSKKDYSQSIVYAINSGDGLNSEISEVESEYVVEFDSEKLPFKLPGMSDVMPYESIRYCDMTEEMLESWKAEFREAVKSAIEEYRPDIVISHHLWLLTGLASECCGELPLFSFCHGTDIRQLKKGCVYKDYLIESCKKIDRIFALSQDQKKEIEKLYKMDGEKIDVIGGGFDSEKFFFPKKSEKSGDTRLVYVGKLSYAKGAKSLIRALDKVEREVKLLMVGSGAGPEKEDILKLAKNSSKEVEFLGQVSQAELAKIFRSCDVFVLPSFYEGLSLVAIEALASGLRVVISEIEGLKETLGERINDSGLIEYVELPNMENVDEPSEYEIEQFEIRVAKAIEKQIKSLDRECDLDKFKDVEADIEKNSWLKISEKLDKKIKSFEFNK